MHSYFSSITLEIPNNLSGCFRVSFFIFSRENKNAEVLERGLLPVLFSGSLEEEKLRSPREIGFLVVFSSLSCYLCHSVDMISRIQ